MGQVLCPGYSQSFSTLPHFRKHTGDKNKEIPASIHEGHTIPGKSHYEIYTCGAENTWTGTEGTFDLFDKKEDKIIRHFYWNSPWSGANKFWVSETNSAWSVEHSPISDDGALGRVDVRIFKL